MRVRPTKSFFAFHSFRQQLTDHDRNHRAEVTDHRQLVLARPATMNVAVASAHRALARAEISAHHIDQRFAKSGTPRLVANQRRENVALFAKTCRRPR